MTTSPSQPASPGSRWPELRRGLVAILRGITPAEVPGVLDVLGAAGFEVVEIPLNSPDPLRSIEIAAARAPATTVIGAGTVLSPQQVDDVVAAGGRLIVAPNADTAVMRRCAIHNAISMPGVFTATEALSALAAGADALKFFPADCLGAGGITAIRTILPPDTHIGAVGGIDQHNLPAFRAAGIRLFGIGSALYAPGRTTTALAPIAAAIVAAYDDNAV